MLGSSKKDLADGGAYIEIVGGDGKANFNTVKPGKYTAVIVSNSTHEDAHLSKLEVEMVERWFTNPDPGLAK